jgi:hypothetical protein
MLFVVTQQRSLAASADELTAVGSTATVIALGCGGC